MASGFSNCANISSNDNEWGFIKKIKTLQFFFKVLCVLANQLKKSNSGEYSQARPSTGDDTKESSQANYPTGSDHGQKFDVFLSHSGKQKNFCRQLYRDLTNKGVSCFFDEDPESLPIGEDFPSRIFEAAQTCKVAVLVLSKDFLETKWPTLEASSFVKGRHTNPNLIILPLFFMIPPEALNQITADSEKWKQIGISEEERTKWHKALKAIRRINGLKFSEGGNEVEFRDKIVKEICRRLPTQSKRYHVPCMQGEERMFQLKTPHYLFSKYGSNFLKRVAEIDGLVDRFRYGLDDVLAFDDMDPKYRTVFMLLTVYMPPNMSPHKVTEWLAIICNEEISFIEKAVEYLCQKAFIEKIEPEIHIHDPYIELAQSKAKEMGRWLCWKGDQFSTRGLSSQDNAGFELARMEQCNYRSPSQISHRYLQNLLVLLLVDMQNMSKLDLGRMESLRSITLHNCKDLAEIEGMENLLELAWLQISGVHPTFKFPKLCSLQRLQHLEIDIAVSQVFNQLGDLTSCFCLREIKVRCPSLLEFPRLNGLPHLEKVEFSMCDKVKGPLDCTDCVELRSVVLDNCSEMDAPPLLAGNMGKLEKLPSFRCISNLTVLKLGRCGIREPPDLTCCVMLEVVRFFTLKNLKRFPNFSPLRKLKNLSLYNCRRVQDPPDIVGCHELQVFDLLYNDNLKGLPKMDGCPQLEQIKVTWHCENEVIYDGINPDSWKVDDDDESWLEHFKDEIFHFREFPEALKEWQWLKGKTMLAKKYFRGVKAYYWITAPYETSQRSKYYGQNSITLSLRNNKVIAFPTPGRVCEDPDWMNKVQEYFAGNSDFEARPSAASEILAKCLPMDHTQTTELKKSSSGEYSQVGPSTGDTTNLSTKESSLPAMENTQPHASQESFSVVPQPLPRKTTYDVFIKGDHIQKRLDKDVFLSDSGKQKFFVWQLELTNQGVSCFFGQNRESLPVAEDFPSRIFEAAKTCKVAVLLLSNDFPPRIFEAAKTCKVAVLLLSNDFLETKWPMLELFAFVETRDTTRTNTNLKILALLFIISPDGLKNMMHILSRKELEISEEKRVGRHQALNAIRRNNGLKFSEGEDEVEFRDEIVKEIWHILPTPSPRYPVPCMQGQLRICQEIADCFNTVHPKEKGIRIAGLSGNGIAGDRKTTLGKASCNFKLGPSEGEVCHPKFFLGDSCERTLKYPTHGPQSHLQTSQDQQERKRSTAPSKLCDVFINHRGLDFKRNLATQFYENLKCRGLWAFLDRQQLEARDAIQIVIFPTQYAHSSWCLNELVPVLDQHYKGSCCKAFKFNHDPSMQRKREFQQEKRIQRVRCKFDCSQNNFDRSRLHIPIHEQCSRQRPVWRLRRRFQQILEETNGRSW